MIDAVASVTATAGLRRVMRLDKVRCNRHLQQPQGRVRLRARLGERVFVDFGQPSPQLRTFAVGWFHRRGRDPADSRERISWLSRPGGELDIEPVRVLHMQAGIDVLMGGEAVRPQLLTN